MARYFYIELQSGTSPGPYNIYHDSVSDSNLAIRYDNNQYAQNISYHDLTEEINSEVGVPIIIPDGSTSIIVVNKVNGLDIPYTITLPSRTPTPTPTVTQTPTITPTVTQTVTPTISITPTNTVTATVTPTISVTPTNTITPTVTQTPTPSPYCDFGIDVTILTPTPTPTVTQTPTITPTVTFTPTNTITPTITPTISVTPTITLTPTVTKTPTITPTISVTPTITPTVTITPTRTQTPTITPTISITPTRTVTPTVTQTPTPTPYCDFGIDVTILTPTPTPTVTLTPTRTPTPTITPTVTKTPTNTPTVTQTPTTTPTPTPYQGYYLDAYGCNYYTSAPSGLSPCSPTSQFPIQLSLSLDPSSSGSIALYESSDNVTFTYVTNKTTSGSPISVYGTPGYYYYVRVTKSSGSGSIKPQVEWSEDFGLRNYDYNSDGFNGSFIDSAVVQLASNGNHTYQFYGYVSNLL